MKLTLFLVTTLYLVEVLAISRPGATTRDVEFTQLPIRSTTPVAPLDLNLTESIGGVNSHKIVLSTKDLSALLYAENIRISFATYTQSPLLFSGELKMNEGKCLFKTLPGAHLSDNAYLTFFRTPECQTMGPRVGSLDLTLKSSGAPRIALWTSVATAAEPSGLMNVKGKEPPNQDQALRVYGSYRPLANFPPVMRATLLAQMWDLPSSGTWKVYSAIGVSFVLACLGLVMSHGAFMIFPSGIWMAMMKSIGIGIAFFAIAVNYAVIVPPFQAPDEPSHLLTFAKLAANPGLSADALVLANKGDFERLTFRRDEKFTELDAQTTRSVPWATRIMVQNSNRSYVGATIWRAVGGYFKSDHASSVLFGLRVMNGGFVAICLALGLFVASFADEPVSATWMRAAPFFAIPTLPFFSMHVSNYPILIGGLVLQALSLGMQVPGRPLVPWAGLSLGLGLGLAAFGGRSGIAMLAFWSILLPLHMFADRTSYWTARSLKCVYSFAALVTFGIGSVIMLFHIPVGDLEVPALDSLASNLTRFGSIRALIETCGLYFLVAILCGPFALWGAAGFVQSIGSRIDKSRQVLPYLAAGLFLSAIAYTLLTHTPQVPDIEMPFVRPPLMTYEIELQKAFFNGIGFGTPDFYVVKTFWFGYGWLESLPNDYVIRFIKLVPTVALIGGLLNSIRQRRAEVVFATIGGLLATQIYLLALGYGYFQESVNVHGRYLIGVYLFYLVICCRELLSQRISWEIAIGKRRFKIYKSGIGLSIGAVAHLYGLIFLMNRYF